MPIISIAISSYMIIHDICLKDEWEFTELKKMLKYVINNLKLSIEKEYSMIIENWAYIHAINI